MKKLDRDRLPRHIAIIMDGNGRWAKMRTLNRIQGHRKGVEKAKEIVNHCSELGIEYLTLYAFSQENWSRPKAEVNALMGLLKNHLKSELKMMTENNIRFMSIGNISQLPVSVQKIISEVEEETSSNSGMQLNLALSYSGRLEIVEAVKKLAEDVMDKKIAIKDITEDMFSGYLYTGDMPDPDLLIRTSGEMRISNFLLWQAAYTELYVTETLWPDFTSTHLLEAILDYQHRERRFGLTAEQLRIRAAR
ncbi:MAG: di-trans,poly-cis-decaprenylcistransferase [Deltaproteobacteria bacterium GWC2_42_11]|nr:MAG: di-trans,poly-cis-decaprenylcistransferase [Deltaproteobacteria bacterium GWC2_42_11]